VLCAVLPGVLDVSPVIILVSPVIPSPSCDCEPRDTFAVM
jgi:hypothetical protein